MSLEPTYYGELFLSIGGVVFYLSSTAGNLQFAKSNDVNSDPLRAVLTTSLALNFSYEQCPLVVTGLICATFCTIDVMRHGACSSPFSCLPCTTAIGACASAASGPFVHAHASRCLLVALLLLALRNGDWRLLFCRFGPNCASAAGACSSAFFFLMASLCRSI